MQDQITTERLRLQLLSLEDDDFIIELLNTEGWITFIGQRNIHTKEDAAAYIGRIMSNPNIFYWVARIKENNNPIGIISFIKRDYLAHYDIGFALLPQFNGQGYAYEAANEVLQMVQQKKFYPVLATTIPQNVQSIKLLTKLGLHFEKAVEVQNEVLHVYSNFIA
jgi:[ribosomal protein S5]-alanine N-acetyltransferase